jgi:hypothetical protein
MTYQAPPKFSKPALPSVWAFNLRKEVPGMMAYQFKHYAVRQALHRLDLDYDQDGLNFFVGVFGASIYLPHCNDAPVVVSFHEQTHPDLAAYFIKRFCRLVEGMGIEVALLPVFKDYDDDDDDAAEVIEMI